MSKKRKYSEEYINYGFTSITVNDEIRPQCVVPTCLKVLGNDSLRPNKLKAHLTSCHPSLADKHSDYFKRLQENVKHCRLDSSGAFQQEVSNAVLASYEVSYEIAKKCQAHTIGESLIAPCANIMVKRMLGETAAKKLSQVSLSNDTVCRRITDISSDIQRQLTSSLSTTRAFSIQIDESCDISSVAHLVGYVRYVAESGMKTDFLFAESLSTTTTSSDIFNTVKAYFDRNGLTLDNLKYCTTDGAAAMVGRKSGFIQLLREVVPSCKAIHCCLHRQALSAKVVGDSFDKVGRDVVTAINFIKASDRNSRLFKDLCEASESQFNRLLYFAAVRWLSRGLAFTRALALKEEIAAFLSSHQHALARKFADEIFIGKLAYLTDILTALNTLNVSLQGENETLFSAFRKIEAFLLKLDMWIRRTESEALEHFSELHKWMISTARECSFQKEILQSLLQLRRSLNKYFESDASEIKSLEWVQLPFGASSLDMLDDEDFVAKEEFISLRCDPTVKNEYESNSLSSFWVARLSEYPNVAAKAVAVLTAFPTTWQCEAAFSTIHNMKSKRRNRLDVQRIVRPALSTIQPNLQLLLSKIQHQPSH